MNKLITYLALLLMFLYSGVQKIYQNGIFLLGGGLSSVPSDVTRMIKNIPFMDSIPVQLVAGILIVAGIWELLASLEIIHL